MNLRSTSFALLVTTGLVAAAWACGSDDSSSPGSDGGGSGSRSGGASSSGGGSGGSSSGSGSGSSSGSSSGGVDGGGDAGVDAAPPSQSVLQRGNDVYRRGTFMQSGLKQSAVSAMAPDTTFNTNATFPANGALTGQGLASVLYLDEGPAQAGCPTGAAGCKATARAAGAGIFLVFPGLGANPNAVAIDFATGLTTWSAHVTNGGSGGGDGVRGTPVVDPASRRVFLVTGNNPHTVHALSVDTGVEVTTGGWPVTLSSTTVSYEDGGFNSGNQNQRGALLLLNGILYVPFGGEDGDGGNYRGWIVAIDTANPKNVGAWATLSPQSGIWASGGLASDGTYVFAETGNSTNVIPPRSASDSEEVVRVTGLAQFSRDHQSVFVANEWQSWDQADRDLGASSPAYVPLPAGSTPPGLLLAPGKGGVVYVLNGADLSSGVYPNDAGGELAEVTVADTGGESVYTSPTVYASTSGLHAAIDAGGAPFACPSGTPSSAGMIMSLLLAPGHSPIAKVAWCTPNPVGTGSLQFPPISTTSDGISTDPIVWFLSGPASGQVAGDSQLTGVDGELGHVLVQTTGAPCQSVPALSFPIAARNRIVVAAKGHLCSWSLGGK